MNDTSLGRLTLLYQEIGRRFYSCSSYDMALIETQAYIPFINFKILLLLIIK